MLTARERRLIESIRVETNDADGAIVDFIMGLDGDGPAIAWPAPSGPGGVETVEPWTPKVGEDVLLTDGISDEHYRVIAVRDGRCKLKWDGTVQDGWFDFDSLAPAPSKAESAPPEDDGPTADEMLDWMDGRGPSLRVRADPSGKWSVDHYDRSNYLARDQPDVRSAIRAAMRKDEP